jgi:hypothetical protein
MTWLGFGSSCPRTTDVPRQSILCHASFDDSAELLGDAHELSAACFIRERKNDLVAIEQLINKLLAGNQRAGGVAHHRFHERNGAQSFSPTNQPSGGHA